MKPSAADFGICSKENEEAKLSIWLWVLSLSCGELHGDFQMLARNPSLNAEPLRTKMWDWDNE